MRLASVLLGSVLVAGTPALGCSHESTGSRDTAGSSRSSDAPRRTPTCTPPGLEAARPAERFDLPMGCSFSPAGSPSAPRVIADAAGLAEVLHCPDGVTLPSLDHGTKDLYLVQYTMSPASAGISAFDDGTRVTLVTRFRPPCEGDPMPMPMNAVTSFVLPKGASRTFVEANCSLPSDCP